MPAKLAQDLVPAVKVNWAIWVPLQFLNFRYVPQNLQARRAAPRRGGGRGRGFPAAAGAAMVVAPARRA